MRAALYIRVSTDEQAQRGESVADQEQALTSWAAKQGHEVVGIYRDEGYSAHRKYTTRPALKRLLEDVSAGNVDVIAFTKLDRWSRRAGDYYTLQDILDSNRVAWVAILEDYDTMTSDGRLKVGIMLSVNQHEAERTSDRIKFTFEEKRKRGEIVSGNMPKGYTLIDHRPVKDPETEAGMTAFWDAYIKTGQMYRAIDAAAAAGLVIKHSSSSFILRNAMHYTGTIQGCTCDPYITVEQAQSVLSTRKVPARRADYCFMFAGLLHCGTCGGRMGSHRHRYSHKDGTDVYQVYYNCTRHYNTRPHECQCRANPSEKELESLCLESLEDAMRRAFEQPQEAVSGPTKAEIDEEINRLTSRRSRGWEAYLDGIVDKQEFEDERRRIDARINELRQITPVAPPKLHKKTTLPEGWRDTYKDLSQENRRSFWMGVLTRIDFFPDHTVQLTVKV